MGSGWGVAGGPLVEHEFELGGVGLVALFADAFVFRESGPVFGGFVFVSLVLGEHWDVSNKPHRRRGESQYFSILELLEKGWCAREGGGKGCGGGWRGGGWVGWIGLGVE